jgi:hypothetical protein
MDKEREATLTRKFFMSLPEGVFVVSDFGYAPGKPLCFESVSPSSDRQRQWKTIVLRGFSNRFCSVFKNQQAAIDYLSLSRRYGARPPAPPRRQGQRLQERTRKTLTKKFLMSLPNGVFIVSNIGAPEQPEYAEYVLSPAPERLRQWKGIVSRRCDNRLCWVFKNEEEAMAHLISLCKDSPPPETPKRARPKLWIVK